ncbi:MAG TPA: phosphoadenosine phosphosulfate reductase [Bacteroidetes bacterium]|nr:phosphoadenosine phosphosulfate reductase [Bacteroidota bacterium]HIL57501.1 phosphoadenosine phosphosulfate reductase [Rhodothermales bacterium]
MPEPRHVVAFSGGKDSSALAIYLHDPERWRRALGKTGLPPRAPLEAPEYVFCDTGTELEETYDYLNRLETYLGTPIQRLAADAPPGETPFDHYLKLYRGFLPSPQMRWCTRKLKLEPYERHVGDDPVISYVGIRADEPDRVGYISTKPTIQTVFPFKEDGIVKEDVYRILEDSGMGRPAYYDWRSRSGCYFCFFQRRSEWVGLLENHPELFERAMAYEREDPETGERYTWGDAEPLVDLKQPERVAQIKQRTADRLARLEQTRVGPTLLAQLFPESGLLDEARDLEDPDAGCSICHL